MSTEILEKRPLCWVLDRDGKKYYKECEKGVVDYARTQKMDISCSDGTVLTTYQIASYGPADIADVYIHYVIPRLPYRMQEKFKNTVDTLSAGERQNLTYVKIRKTIDRWISEEKYYTPTT